MNFVNSPHKEESHDGNPSLNGVLYETQDDARKNLENHEPDFINAYDHI